MVHRRGDKWLTEGHLGRGTILLQPENHEHGYGPNGKRVAVTDWWEEGGDRKQQSPDTRPHGDPGEPERLKQRAQHREGRQRLTVAAGLGSRVQGWDSSMNLQSVRRVRPESRRASLPVSSVAPVLATLSPSRQACDRALAVTISIV